MSIPHHGIRRLHGEINDNDSYTTPAEFEARYYRQKQAAQRRSPDKWSSHRPRGGSHAQCPSMGTVPGLSLFPCS